MYDILHLHNFDGATSAIHKHVHKFSGVTTKNPNFKRHTHYMTGYTEDICGHIHYFAFITGPSFNVKEGHLHFYQAYTTINKMHFHCISGYTSVYSDY